MQYVKSNQSPLYHRIALPQCAQFPDLSFAFFIVAKAAAATRVIEVE